IRAPSQYVCSLDNQRTEAPSGRVSRTWRLATSISVTSLEPTLKTYTVSRPPPPPAAVADCVGAELVSEDDPQAEAMSPSAALLAPLRTVRRSRLEERNQSEPPTNTPFASPREAQSSGTQCEAGWAEARGFITAFDIVRLLPTRRECCRKSLPVKERVLPLAQPRARVHVQEGPPADRVPLRRDRGRLADDVKVAPALGQTTLATVGRAATVPVHQVHRLASAVGGVDRGQPTAGPLLERGLVASRNGVPDLGDHRGAVGTTGVENRVGSTDRVLNLRVLAEPAGPAARRLPGRQLDQRIDAGPGDSGDDGAVVGTEPRLRGQRVRDSRPAAPLIVERDAGVHHRPPLREEDIVDRPVEAAGRS